MNIIFNFSLIISLGLFVIFSPEQAINSMLSASEKAVTLCISLISIYALWLGLLEIVEESGINVKIAKLLSPIIKFLFGKQPDKVNEQLAINLSSNILGLGNASTPSGIKAMKMMDDGSGKANASMVMLMVLNSMSTQIIPTTLIGLKVLYGSTNPTDIIFPILISSFLSTFLAVFLVKLCYKSSKHLGVNK